MKMLENKVAIVTGGASGIGKAVVELFVKEGAKVVIADLNVDLGTQLAKNLGTQTHFVKSNASSPADNEALVKETLEKFGRLDIAVNNAGIGGATAATGEYEIEEWQKVISINLDGVFYGMRYQIPAMLNNGGGSIINIASILGQVGFAGSPAYVAAKHGVVGLTKTAAWDYGTQNIRINAVGPGFIETPLLSSMDPQVKHFLESQHAMQRLGKSEEVAEIILWLASDKASFATGGYYPIEGGYLAK
ncbi:glucose 1-dehydrogenase [Myroides sp. DF42-4-2]|uniref:SDR family NAD(P)-dependent oxidoreductase n=1 Tax=unclassified Myroides TaxID=2642485 RepID=UPI00257895AC|nr:glucose 1-dehydrogenase [Myroides sp. DF42-4-2]MDM1407879.1 SDR family oxidoreductase [Myroides sp. DF42-4-2]